jgi:hypothetical protein
LPRERGFADLACPEQNDHGMLAQQARNAPHVSLSADQRHS